MRNEIEGVIDGMLIRCGVNEFVGEGRRKVGG